MYYYFVFILGLILGSFYNVVILRTISGESLLFPKSYCPNCKTTIEWKHKIPVISYLILKGRCKYCNSHIDIMYPIVELLTATTFLALLYKFKLSYEFIINTIAMSLFLILASMDIKSKKISSKYAIFLIISCFLCNCHNIYNSIIGGVIGFIFVKLLIFLSRFIKKEIIGEGDIYMISALCAFVGLNHILYALVSSTIFLIIFTLPKILKKYIYPCLWFITAYILLFLYKISVINMNIFFTILIFVNFFISLFVILKRLIKDIQNDYKPIITAVSPSLYFSALVFCLIF